MYIFHVNCVFKSSNSKNTHRKIRLILRKSAFTPLELGEGQEHEVLSEENNTRHIYEATVVGTAFMSVTADPEKVWHVLMQRV